MFCVKCGQENSGANKYCIKCNAVLLQMAPETTVTSAINVEEGVEYLLPEKDYECVWFSDFVGTVNSYLEGETDLDEVKRVYGNIKSICESFDHMELPGFLHELEGLRETEFGGEYSRQLNYLINKGVQLITDGLQMVGASLDDLDPEHTEAVQKGLDIIQDGINQLGLSEEFIGLHIQMVEEELQTRKQEAASGEAGQQSETEETDVTEL